MWIPALQLLLPLLLVGGVVYCVVFFIQKHSRSNEEQDLEKYLFGLLNGYAFSLPDEEKKDFLKLKSEDGTEPKALDNALMRRAVANIPRIRKMQEDNVGVRRLYGSYMLHDNIFQGFLHADAAMKAEMKEVQMEAEALHPGWGQGVFSQANQIYNQMMQRQMAAARAKREEQMKQRAAQVEAARAKAQVDQAEKAMAELLEEENKVKGLSMVGGGKKQ